jgi:hypothetical protein
MRAGAGRRLAGWLGLGGLFAVLGLTAPAIARWGARTGPIAPAEETAANQPVYLAQARDPATAD